MDEFHGLIRACAASPDDDLPRLVLADWLDDRGESAWARFIRVQIELHPHRGDYARPGVIELEREERQLLRRARAWLLRLGVRELGRRQRVTFSRGLPGKLRSPLGQFLRDGPRLLAELPTVNTLALVMNRDGRVPGELPILPQVRHLELYGQFDILDWAGGTGLSFCPQLASLRTSHFLEHAEDLTRIAARAPAGLREVRFVDYTGSWEDYADERGERGSPSLSEYRAAAPGWSFDWVRPHQGGWHHGDEFARATVRGLPYSGPGRYERHDGASAVVSWLPPALLDYVRDEERVRPLGRSRDPLAEQLLDWWDSGQCVVEVE